MSGSFFHISKYPSCLEHTSLFAFLSIVLQLRSCAVTCDVTDRTWCLVPSIRRALLIGHQISSRAPSEFWSLSKDLYRSPTHRCISHCPLRTFV
ncbi:hypothetical protein BO83DRAFT_32314 [Aspergillus eucalypticola CBS 122712]|uniref:Uncharacterized protein n=1 Tax=Aspergillus eucalypticola (strain CBS 122712 / IBT 29274) TaxID=1448314 RepID=A0A317VG38_ASPEC|nr:uncharacterized protein BO83DRAFT_32314 [Aspergillus eucalypticola CBS 122712]PWY73344.1 hypothetical protein BO83DRAFT_32314 [Aspergillus eucalypticola CBS 122712]